MSYAGKKTKLGFTDEEFNQGVHICQIYNTEEERIETLDKFIASGLTEHECTACFSDKETIDHLSSNLHDKEINLEENIKEGDFSLSGVNEIYFTENKFNPERMLGLLTDFFLESHKKNYSGARVIGEMTPKVKDVAGGNRLLEYESRVSLLQKKYPISAVCQYNANEFDGATIMNILKVHPLMIVKGNIIHNPFFIPPEEFLANN